MKRNAHGVANFCEMGTGKTAMAITAAVEMDDVTRVLVVCPSTLKYNWADEWEMWAKDWDVFNCVGTPVARKKALDGALDSEDTCVLIVNYEMLTGRLFDAIVRFSPQLIIADESHYVKSHKSKRAKALKRIPCKYKFALTGTPTPNNPLDIWSQLDWLRRGYLSANYYAFRSVHANVYTGAGFPIIRSYRNLTELDRKLSKYRFRVTKDECLDLPDRVFVKQHVELSNKAGKMYKELCDYMVTELGDEEVSASIVLVKMLRLQQITGGSVKTDNEGMLEVGSEKLDALKELASGIPNEKIVVFARFNYEIGRITKMFEAEGREVFVLTGATPAEERNAHVKRFQETSEPQVLVANIAVGGVGLNLTKAAYCVYFSRTFSYGEAKQSADRIHRNWSRPQVYVLRPGC